MSDATFTQEQVNEQIATAKTQWETDVLNPIVSERDELLQFKPKDLTDEEKALQTKQQELWQKEVNLSLKENGLDKFASIIKVSNDDELKGVIGTLNTLINELKVEMGYKPNDHKQQDQYNVAKQQGNTKGMIKSLFGM